MRSSSGLPLLATYTFAGCQLHVMRRSSYLHSRAAPYLPAGSQLGVIDTVTSSLTRLSTGYSSYRKLAVLQSSDGLTVVTLAGSPSKAQALVKLQVTQLERPVAAQCRYGSTQHGSCNSFWWFGKMSLQILGMLRLHSCVRTSSPNKFSTLTSP
jgi:hypothetical protein